MLSRVDEFDLLTALYDGMGDFPIWNTFLSRLRRRLGAERMRMYLVGGADRHFSGFSITVEPERSHGTINELDEAIKILLRSRLRAMRVYTSVEVNECIPEGSEVFGANCYVRIVRVVSAGIEGWLIASRGDTEFSTAESSLLDALTPHLEIALRIYSFYEHAKLRSSATDKAACLRRQGWFLLTADGVILDNDREGAKHLLGGSLLYAGSDGRLHGTMKKSEQRLAETIRSFAAGDVKEPAVIQISDRPGLGLSLLIQPFAIEGASIFSSARLIVYVQAEATDDTDRSRELAVLLNLTPREAQLAQAISRGSGIPGAAAELGVSVETARKYSKTVYCKTNSHGQAALTRMVRDLLGSLG